MQKLKAIISIIFAKEWVSITDNNMYGQVKKISYNAYIRHVCDNAVRYSDANSGLIINENK